jgi:hypothetical protein
MGNLALIASKFIPPNVRRSQVLTGSYRPSRWDQSSADVSPQIPLIVAIDVLQSADRRLFPDAPALSEAVTGALATVYGSDPASLAAMREFADALLLLLGADALSEGGGQLAKKTNAHMLIAAFGVAIRHALEAE